jgi:DNA-binding winged helix-turn-helix (wHTH) protein
MDDSSAAAGSNRPLDQPGRVPQGVVLLLWAPDGLSASTPLGAGQTQALAETLLALARQLLHVPVADGATPLADAGTTSGGHRPALTPAPPARPLRSGPFQVEGEHGLVRWRGPEGWVALDLTEVERRLFRQLLQATGKVCSRLDIAQGLWRSDIHHLRTVDQSVRRLRGSLLQAGVPDCIRTVRGVGYRLEVETAAVRAAPAEPSATPAHAGAGNPRSKRHRQARMHGPA